MNLFDNAKEGHLKKAAPLADRMRPEMLDDIIGQETILAPGKLLRRAIEADRISSLIFHGPPGTGKTSIASVIAKATKKYFAKLNAVTSGVQDIRKLISEADERLGMYQQQTIVFIDEIHRFNKGQQDALLPAVERGVIILIGATTENPYFSINAALLSRSMVFQLNPLEEEQIIKLLEKCLKDKTKGLGSFTVQIADDALKHFAHNAQGDARIALNALELAVITTKPNSEGMRIIDLNIAEESIQRPAVVYDGTGDQHYDIISAFIKSMRGSDPDATLHYLARMLDAGEDPLFIARRIVIHAAEDVGMADPQGLVIAQSAAEAVKFIGLPEGKLILAQAALYIAVAPKSNSVLKGIEAALSDVRKGNIGPVPLYLRDAHYSGAQKLGHGIDYKYPHDYPKSYIKQQYLPDKLINKKYYQPTANGLEEQYINLHYNKNNNKTE